MFKYENKCESCETVWGSDTLPNNCPNCRCSTIKSNCLKANPVENRVIVSEPKANGAVADFYQYGILILDVMKLKFFSNKDDFDTAKDILLNNDKRLIYFKKKNGYWTQPEVYS